MLHDRATCSSSATSPPTTSPTIYPILVIPDTCNNGVVGVEGGGQCCALACDRCKDNGCRNRAKNANLTKDDCCPDRISNSSVYCEDVGIAPCILDKPWVLGFGQIIGNFHPFLCWLPLNFGPWDDETITSTRSSVMKSTYLWVSSLGNTLDFCLPWLPVLPLPTTQVEV